jgi:hypothetical protein
MKGLLIAALTLSSLSAFAQTLVCGVYLMDIKTNESVAHKLMEQSVYGMSAGNANGSEFFNETVKRRFLKKPLTTSKIVFTDILDGGTLKATLQFYRKTEPNKYDILTKTQKLGEQIVVSAGEEKFTLIDEKYAVKSYCNIKD